MRIVIDLRQKVEFDALVGELLFEVVDVVKEVDLFELVLQRIVCFPVLERRVCGDRIASHRLRDLSLQLVELLRNGKVHSIEVFLRVDTCVGVTFIGETRGFALVSNCVASRFVVGY